MSPHESCWTLGAVGEGQGLDRALPAPGRTLEKRILGKSHSRVSRHGSSVITSACSVLFQDPYSQRLPSAGVRHARTHTCTRTASCGSLSASVPNAFTFAFVL